MKVHRARVAGMAVWTALAISGAAMADMITNPAAIPDFIRAWPDAGPYTGSLASETNRVALKDVQILQPKPKTTWCGVTRTTVGGEEKKVVIILVAWGALQMDKSAMAKDPVFNMIFIPGQEWHVLKGVSKDKAQMGSWAFILPPFSRLDNRRAERALPLVEMGLTPEGTISVLKFGDETGSMALYVPGRAK